MEDSKSWVIPRNILISLRETRLNHSRGPDLTGLLKCHEWIRLRDRTQHDSRPASTSIQFLSRLAEYSNHGSPGDTQTHLALMGKIFSARRSQMNHLIQFSSFQMTSEASSTEIVFHSTQLMSACSTHTLGFSRRWLFRTICLFPLRSLSLLKSFSSMNRILQFVSSAFSQGSEAFCFQRFFFFACCSF